MLFSSNAFMSDFHNLWTLIFNWYVYGLLGYPTKKIKIASYYIIKFH